jgi:antitoxin CptB
MNVAIDDLDRRRRRVLWRARHRGIKEMDLLLGPFADRHVWEMGPQALSELEAIVALADQDLLAWIMGQAPVPADSRSATLDALIAFRP